MSNFDRRDENEEFFNALEDWSTAGLPSLIPSFMGLLFRAGRDSAFTAAGLAAVTSQTIYFPPGVYFLPRATPGGFVIPTFGPPRADRAPHHSG